MTRYRYIATSLLLAALTSLIGCAAQLQTASSGEIGCPRDEIVVSEQTTGWNTSSWTAACRGKSYYCSGIAGSISCHERQETSSAPASGDEVAVTTPSPSAAAKEPCDRPCDEGRICVSSCPASASTSPKSSRLSANHQAQHDAPRRRHESAPN